MERTGWVKMCMTIELRNKSHEKARLKEDGVYSIRGTFYRVRDGQATHCAMFGKIIAFCGQFNTHARSYDYNTKTGRDAL